LIGLIEDRVEEEFVESLWIVLGILPEDSEVILTAKKTSFWWIWMLLLMLCLLKIFYFWHY